MIDFAKNRAIIRQNGDTKLCVGHLPERKRIAIYTETSTSFSALGYFLSEDDANRFVRIMEGRE